MSLSIKAIRPASSDEWDTIGENATIPLIFIQENG
jgi:hypothetical protein